jgi:dihydrofolate synthase/folylpolyglutamate synthase
VPAIVGARSPATDPVFEREAARRGAPLRFVPDSWQVTRHEDNTYDLGNDRGITFHRLAPDLQGMYQRKNIPVALEALLQLRATGLRLPDQAIRDGLSRVVPNTGLLGRWQELASAPYTVCDTAHNLDGITETVAQISTRARERLHVVLGIVNDKDAGAILRALPPDATYYFTRAAIPRALDEKLLARQARAAGLHGQDYPTVAAAYAAARAAARPADMIYIGGSTFVVAEVLE